MNDDLVLPEIGISEENSVSRHKSFDNTWIVNENAPLKNIKCHISPKFIDKLIAIECAVSKKLGKTTEFGCYIKGNFVDNELYVDNKDIYIPKQTVESATVDFGEPLPNGYNGVVHRHPTGCSSFSGTDDTYINSNCEFSLLFENHSIKQAIINIKTQHGFRIQVPMTVIVDRYVSIKDIDVSGVELSLPKATLFYYAPKNDIKDIFGCSDFDQDLMELP